MKIGIDARLWGTKHTGIGRYTKELINNLQLVDTANDYVIFCKKEDIDNIKVPKGWKKVIANIPHYSLNEQITLPGIFSREALDLLHVPHFNTPIFYNKPFVITIHDILWHKKQNSKATTLNPLVYSVKQLGYKIILNHSIKHSKKILVPSITVASEIIKEFALSEEKVVVTYEGIPLHKGNQKERKITKTRTPYLLYVGNLYPHKNAKKLIEAMEKVKKPTELVIVCGRNVFLDRFKKELNAQSVKDRIKLLGYVSDEKLASLYKNAEAFVFPTLHEGFGLPGLEAMTYGTAVICSNIPVLKEIYGNAAFYLDPHNVQDIAKKINKALNDKNLRNDLIKKGKVQIKKYSWRKMAQQTLNTYMEMPK